MVGPFGTVVALDVPREYLTDLAKRVQGLKLTNVRIALGDPHDPRLPANVLDAAILVHMYHEIAEPYAFLYNLTPALKAGARVGIVDLDRQVQQHGTSTELLRCELAAIGYRELFTRSRAMPAILRSLNLRRCALNCRPLCPVSHRCGAEHHGATTVSRLQGNIWNWHRAEDFCSAASSGSFLEFICRGLAAGLVNAANKNAHGDRPPARQSRTLNGEQQQERQKPTLIAYNVKLNDDQAIWTRIGAAWAHKKGSGFSIQLDALPLEGRIVLVAPALDPKTAS